MKFFISLLIFSALILPEAFAAKKQCRIMLNDAQKLEQQQKDIDLPDRFEAQRDWGSKFLSDNDSTWRDPEYLARIQEFAVPNITNYGGKAHSLVSEYHTYMNNFFKGEVKHFTSNGTDANNMLFLYAQANLTQRLGKEPTAMKILTFSDIYGGSYGPILTLSREHEKQIDAPYFKTGEKLDAIKLNALKKKERAALKLIEEQISDLKNQVGAIFMEAIPASHGVKMFRPEFLQKLRALADKYETPIYVDEIMSGGGRTGKFWGFMHYEGFIPDLVTFGKGLALSGIFQPKRDADYRMREPSLGYAPPATTMVNPLALVQALQVLKTIWERRLDLNAAATGAYLMARTREALDKNADAKFRNSDGLSGIGLLITGFPFYELTQKATSGKIFTAGYNSRILPVLTTTKEDVDWVIDHHLGW